LHAHISLQHHAAIHKRRAAVIIGKCKTFPQ